MKIIDTIKKYGSLSLMAGALLLSSCQDYLDVVPPEQAGLPDATRNYDATLAFLYSTFAGINNPMASYSGLEAASDEFVNPPLWNEAAHRLLYDLNNPVAPSGGNWGGIYRYIGQCHLFLSQLPNAQGVSDEDKKEWAAEANFMIAYYHMQVLLTYGPCAITDTYIDMDAPESTYPGRSHFDYVVDWIVNKFDEVTPDLPASRSGEKWGRPTSTIAKALKARLLVYAASPLWNGSFPYPQWKNKNFETPGYGYDLVSLTYDRNKWERAKVACEEALSFATSQGGHALYTDEEAYARESVPLPFVPGVNANTTEGLAFLKKVMLMRYLVTTRVTENNREIIWGHAGQGSIVVGSLPHHILTQTNGNNLGGYNAMSPVLNTSIEYFYTKNGKRPAHDATFYPENIWFNSAGVSGRNDIITLNVDREPRFYAWFAFDGGDYGNRIKNEQPLTINLKDPDTQGYNPDKYNRDNNVTGYLSQKFIMPRLSYNLNGGNNNESKPRPLIRLAELYLNLAECYAALDDVPNAIANLNVIRNRAGVPDLTTADLSAQSITEWVQNERFIELWGEGHRYYDVRRWMLAPQTMGQNMRTGLSAYGKKAPTFAEFNTVAPINQPFVWTNRMYLLPLFNNEVYKNPQFVQSPGY
ncbi:MAG: RagB/SusD family nutrient uptake outer membrane protein [Capnocytophaga sp.]|nr:RagB/SusD family nutrient uptake outer membrane protein [Capnocytophaga sp.]